jgi:hypothetical protein
LRLNTARQEVRVAGKIYTHFTSAIIGYSS